MGKITRRNPLGLLIRVKICLGFLKKLMGHVLHKVKSGPKVFPRNNFRKLKKKLVGPAELYRVKILKVIPDCT